MFELAVSCSRVHNFMPINCHTHGPGLAYEIGDGVAIQLYLYACFCNVMYTTK